MDTVPGYRGSRRKRGRVFLSGEHSHTHKAGQLQAQRDDESMENLKLAFEPGTSCPLGGGWNYCAVEICFYVTK